MQVCEGLDRTGSWQVGGGSLRMVSGGAPVVVRRAGRFDVLSVPAGGIVVRVAVALVPWGVLAWMFIAR